jgi:hypothetical protein
MGCGDLCPCRFAFAQFLGPAEKRIALLNGKKEYKAGVYCHKQYSP